MKRRLVVAGVVLVLLVAGVLIYLWLRPMPVHSAPATRAPHGRAGRAAGWRRGSGMRRSTCVGILPSPACSIRRHVAWVEQGTGEAGSTVAGAGIAKSRRSIPIQENASSTAPSG